MKISHAYRQLWKRDNSVDYYVLWCRLSDDVDNVERALRNAGFSHSTSKIIEGIYGLQWNSRVLGCDEELYEKGEDSSDDIAKILGSFDTSKIPIELDDFKRQRLEVENGGGTYSRKNYRVFKGQAK